METALSRKSAGGDFSKEIAKNEFPKRSAAAAFAPGIRRERKFSSPAPAAGAFGGFVVCYKPVKKWKEGGRRGAEHLCAQRNCGRIRPLERDAAGSHPAAGGLQKIRGAHDRPCAIGKAAPLRRARDRHEPFPQLGRGGDGAAARPGHAGRGAEHAGPPAGRRYEYHRPGSAQGRRQRCEIFLFVGQAAHRLCGEQPPLPQRSAKNHRHAGGLRRMRPVL